MGHRHEAATAAASHEAGARRRRVVLVALLGLALAGAAAWALAARRGGGSTVLEIEPDPIDFGAHPYGDRVDRKVRLVNRSPHAVTIQDPTFDCSCFLLLAPPASLQIEAGGSLDVVVRMDTLKAFPGRFRKAMTVPVVSPSRERVDVAVLGEVLDYREITPREVAFGLVPASGPTVERRVAVRRGASKSKIEVKRAVSGEPRVFDVAVEPGSDGADLVLRTRKDAPAGAFRAQVLIDLEVSAGEGAEPHRYDETIWVTGTVR